MLNTVTELRMLRIEFCSYLATTTGSCIIHWWHCNLFLQHSGRTEIRNV